MEDRIRVAVYARVSTDNQDDSLPNQLQFFNDFIGRQGNMELIKVYEDDGISGTNTDKRDDFNLMIEDASSREFDMVLTKAVTRFARNTLDSIYYTRKLKNDYNIDVVFVLDSIDTRRPDYELLLTIMSSIAQDESRKTSESVKFGQKIAMKNGVVFGRKEMLGYRVVGKRQMVIDEEEAEIVRSIFNKYLHEGKGTHVIARELNEDGIKPFNIDNRNKSNYWSNTVILKILRNEKYVGDLKQQKTWTKSYLDHKKRYNKGEIEFVFIKDHHPAIIDRDTWNKTKEELRRRSPDEEVGRKYSNRYWCSGKIRCGECGTPFSTRTKKLKNGQVYRAWRCIKSGSQGSKKEVNGEIIGCSSESVNERVLATVINTILEQIVINKTQIKAELLEEIKIVREVKGTSKDKDRLIKQIEKLIRDKEKLLKLRLNEELSAEEFKISKAKFNKEIEDIQSKLKDIESLDTKKEKEADVYNKYVQRIDDLLDFNEDYKVVEVYKEIIGEIEVYNQRILHIKLNCLHELIKLQYATKGRLDNYTVEIEFIE